MGEEEFQIINTEVNKLLHKGVIVKTNHSEGEFISDIFCRPKKDGSHRLILNLKRLNHYVEYHHFKMETFQNVLQLIKPHCWMAVIDLRDAYYSVPICTKERKYLRFQHNGALYEFVCLPNGLSSAPRIFTKLLKPVFSKLRSEGVLLIGYIDDLILIADDPATLLQHIRKTTELLTFLGFTIHSEKSALIPSQRAVFLGFLIDTVAMTVNMTTVKADKVKSAINALLEPAKPKTREVASLVGLMVSSFLGVRYGPLHYRTLENEKTDMLKTSGGNLNNYMFLSEQAVTDLHWWLENVHKDPNPISLPPSQLTLKCDSSLSGWGAVIEGTSNTTNGRWSSLESMQHINYLEIKAILFGVKAILFALKALCSHLHDCHVKVLTDNQQQ